MAGIKSLTRGAVGGAIAGFVLTLAGTLPAAAQSITLAEAYNRMMGSEVELQILGVQDKIATEMVRQAKGQRYPRVSLSLSYTQTQQNILSSDNTTFANADSKYPTATITLSVHQPIYDPVRWRAMSVAQAQQALTTAQAEVARNQLARDLTRTYLDVASAQFEVTRSRTLVQARTQLERALELQISAGRGDQMALTRAQGDTFSARSDLADAELKQSDALFALYRYTGPGYTSVSAAGGLAAIAPASFSQTFTEARLLDMSPEVQVARAQLALAEKQREQTRANYRPTAELTLNFTQQDTQGSLFGGGSNIQTTDVGVGVNWSIYEGGVRRSQMREADARVEMAQLRVTQAEDLAKRTYASLIAAINVSNQHSAAVSNQLRLAEQALSDAKAQEQAGKVGVEVTMEQQLRRDILRVDIQSARLRTMQLQAEVYALFGALDTNSLSGRTGG
ncbi:MAG: TolC family protein [Limimaricola sp.]|uniref:TolC family protein n=1 Tax=Limimaricola sp. TaxID=2211665 RepID=UPI001DF53421|nr:TolC family protein [Limimaricola sp.]MBI1417656.1 TolC family protein [Limimaricola sp.]